MSRLLTHLRRNVIGYLALFVALGGTSYAAFSLPKNSVGTRQLRNGAVTNKKLGRAAVNPANLSHKTIAGYMRAYAQIGPGGQLMASRPGAHLLYWNTTGPGPGGLISWNQRVPTSCFALATTTATGPEPAYASALMAGPGGFFTGTYVHLSADQGPTSGPGVVSVAVMCPQP
jgi:hypothetical protein